MEDRRRATHVDRRVGLERAADRVAGSRDRAARVDDEREVGAVDRASGCAGDEAVAADRFARCAGGGYF